MGCQVPQLSVMMSPHLIRRYYFFEAENIKCLIQLLHLVYTLIHIPQLSNQTCTP